MVCPVWAATAELVADLATAVVAVVATSVVVAEHADRPTGLGPCSVTAQVVAGPRGWTRSSVFRSRCRRRRVSRRDGSRSRGLTHHHQPSAASGTPDSSEERGDDRGHAHTSASIRILKVMPDLQAFVAEAHDTFSRTGALYGTPPSRSSGPWAGVTWYETSEDDDILTSSGSGGYAYTNPAGATEEWDELWYSGWAVPRLYQGHMAVTGASWLDLFDNTRDPRWREAVQWTVDFYVFSDREYQAFFSTAMLMDYSAALGDDPAVVLGVLIDATDTDVEISVRAYDDNSAEFQDSVAHKSPVALTLATGKHSLQVSTYHHGESVLTRVLLDDTPLTFSASDNRPSVFSNIDRADGNVRLRVSGSYAVFGFPPTWFVSGPLDEAESTSVEVQEYSARLDWAYPWQVGSVAFGNDDPAPFPPLDL